jgi:hypothetical protein
MGCVWEYYSVFVKQPDCLLLISSLRYTLDANRIFRMAAAVVGTAVGLYTVVNQDTNHGAEHHPLGDPHGEGGAQKTGTGSTVGEENKQDEPEEETKDESKDESKEESKDESKEEPKSDQQNPSKPTKENSEEKDTQSPDQSDKVSIAAG